MDTRYLIKVGMARISILYAVCFAAVAVYPQIRILAMKYGLQRRYQPRHSRYNALTFVTGLILWNLTTALNLRPICDPVQPPQALDHIR